MDNFEAFMDGTWALRHPLSPAMTATTDKSVVYMGGLTQMPSLQEFRTAMSRMGADLRGAALEALVGLGTLIYNSLVNRHAY